MQALLGYLISMSDFLYRNFNGLGEFLKEEYWQLT